jgi:hypothetical protein
MHCPSTSEYKLEESGNLSGPKPARTTPIFMSAAIYDL